MSVRIARRRPDRDHTELATATFMAVPGAVQSAPGMSARLFDSPAGAFGVPYSSFDLLVWMTRSHHKFAVTLARMDQVVN